MTRYALALLTACLVTATAGVADAKPLDVDDDYDRDYDRDYERGSVGVASASGVAFRVPSASGSLEQFGQGAGLALSWLDVGGEFPTGFEADAIFVTGDDGGRFYDLGLSIIGSGKIGKNLAVPFASVGLDLSGVSLPTSVGDNEGGIALGVHGNVGLHGFLTEDVYWRGQVGYLGAAIGGVKAQLSVGWVFGRD
jgi:hypothetical protein